MAMEISIVPVLPHPHSAVLTELSSPQLLPGHKDVTHGLTIRDEWLLPGECDSLMVCQGKELWGGEGIQVGHLGAPAQLLEK